MEALGPNLPERLKADGSYEQMVESAKKQTKSRVEQLSRDPLLCEYVKSTKGDHAPRITQPWQVLAEQKMYNLLFLLGRVEPIGHSYDFPDAQAYNIVMGGLLSSAKTFLWSKKIFDMLKEYPLPDHVLGSDLLPFPITYHSLEVAYDMKFIGTGMAGFKQSAKLDSDGMLLLPTVWGIMLCTFLTEEGNDQKKYVISIPIPFGKKYPSDFDESHAKSVRQILSMLAFLRSPYTDLDKRKIPRPFRRRGDCAPADIERRINVVVLRSETKSAIKDYALADIERKHQWWVRGHFRAQWYASKKSHEVIWIAPHLKGPSHAPILEKVYSVVR